MITLYTKNVCPKCVFIKSRLQSTGVEHTIINIDNDEEARDMLIDKGFRMAPIMKHDDNFVLDTSEMIAIIEDEIS